MDEDVIKELVDKIREEATQLRQWAMESQSGGWSTHQVDPMRRRADALDMFLHERGL